MVRRMGSAKVPLDRAMTSSYSLSLFPAVWSQFNQLTQRRILATIHTFTLGLLFSDILLLYCIQ